MRWGVATRPISPAVRQHPLVKTLLLVDIVRLSQSRGLEDSDNEFSWNKFQLDCYIVKLFGRIFKMGQAVFNWMMGCLFWFCMTNIFLGILEAFMKPFVCWQATFKHPLRKLCIFCSCFVWMVASLEFCRGWDESVYVYVGVLGNVLLGVFEGSIHPLSWTSWHRTLDNEMQCWLSFKCCC